MKEKATSLPIMIPKDVITDDTLDNLTETIHFLRFENGLSLQQFSEKTGVPVDVVIQLEAGIVPSQDDMFDLRPFIQISETMKDRFVIVYESGL